MTKLMKGVSVNRSKTVLLLSRENITGFEPEGRVES